MQTLTVVMPLSGLPGKDLSSRPSWIFSMTFFQARAAGFLPPALIFSLFPA